MLKAANQSDDLHVVDEPTRCPVPAKETSAQRPLARLKVMFINRSYWPDAEATGQLLAELCEDLSAESEVSVIAGQPNHNVEAVQFKRFGWARRNRVNVRRVWHTRLPKASLLGRAINYVSFVFSATLAALFAPKPQVIVVETDPPLLCFVGALVCKLRGVKLVIYLQDIYPDIAVALGKLPDNFMTRWLRWAMFSVYRRADRVVVLSRDMRELLVRSGVAPGRISCVPNWADCDVLVPAKSGNRFRERYALEGRFVVMYSGNLGMCQRLEDVIEAARLLRDRTDIVFLLVGAGVLKAQLADQVAEHDLRNVQFLPYQPKEDLSHSLSAAQLHLVPVDPRIVSCLMPSKLYGILASGTPALAIAPADCELAQIVRDSRVGIDCAPGDPEQLADTIQRLAFSPELLAEWGRRARQLAETTFDRPIATSAFANVLRSVAEGGLELHPQHGRPNVPAQDLARAEPVVP